MRKWKIDRECLDTILESSKSMHPREFAGFLRADGDVIREVLLLPGMIHGDRHAMFNLAMLPIDYSIVGTVHSHPSLSNKPSKEDLQMFFKYGKVHIIVAMPYNEKSWKAYDWNGREIEVEIIE
ncbi:MAG: hypothetical protein DRN09_02075 [Thermoplasmata archaeon]|nr:MAG: hypothetical protein DRN09_02075 [Thermoplasmata archaeon]